MRIRLTLDIHRDPKSTAVRVEPKPPAIFDVSKATIERKPQWDHDRRPPVGFTRQETT